MYADHNGSKCCVIVNAYCKIVFWYGAQGQGPTNKTSHELGDYFLSPHSLPFKLLPPSLSHPSLLSSLPISVRNTLSYSLPLHFPPPRIVPQASTPTSLYLCHFLGLSLTHTSHLSLTLLPRHPTKSPPLHPLPARPPLSPYPNVDLHPLYPSHHLPISPSLDSLPLPLRPPYSPPSLVHSPSPSSPLPF